MIAVPTKKTNVVICADHLANQTKYTAEFGC
jgi:hypothetical protein